MQLIHMDVERHGDRCPVRLGPFSSGLNAICGPKGSGKTALVHWLRTALAPAVADAGTLPAPAMTGSLQWTQAGHRWQVHTYRDGSHTRSASPTAGNLSLRQQEVFAALAAASGATDSEAALESLAAKFQFDTPANGADPQRDAWLGRLRELESRLQHLPQPPVAHDSLLARRSELERELLTARAAHGPSSGLAGSSPADRRRWDSRQAAIESDLRATQTRIEELDRQLAALRDELHVLETSHSTVTVDHSYRQQLQELDDRLTRWRQTLRDLKAHRTRLEYEATDARLDKQVGEQLAATKQPDPRAPLRSLEAQILSARKQLDALIDRTTLLSDTRGGQTTSAGGYAAPGRSTHDDPVRDADPYYLPETLRSMQRDLYEACQQLARHEAHAASHSLRQQLEQLQRCETELLHSVEKLIEERAHLLRRIADQYQLSNQQLALAFGNWCDCHDHRHLHDWLLDDSQVASETVGHDPLARQRLLQQIDQAEAERTSAQAHADHCKRQLHDTLLQRQVEPRLPIEPRRAMADIERELEQLLNQLRLWDERHALHRECDELRQRLSTAASPARQATPFREAVHRHLLGLMGDRGRWAAMASVRHSSEVSSPRYDLVDGLVYEPAQRSYADGLQTPAPAAFVRLALRLAIAEAMATRGEPLVVVVDEALDHVPPDLQPAAVLYLAQVAAAGQQIVLLTGDQRIADAVHHQQGYVAYLHRATSPVVDINRHLTALANDYESEKWYQPMPVQTPAPRGETALRVDFYLTPRSRVEEAPSIDALAAARCRAAGVIRISDLLEADPRWLAEQIGLEDVHEATVAKWQAEARLLCGVRQLRPFDARLLVAVGVRSPQQLADMHPSQLLERVEDFLATPRGRRLLRSGSSYELSRITTWIASAKGGTSRFGRSSFSDEPYAADRSRAHANGRGGEVDDWRHSDASRQTRRSRPAGTPRDQRSTRRRRSGDNLKLAQTDVPPAASAPLRFHLDLASPVVDAPSIGPKMAGRLERIGITSVDQLLAASPEALADKLKLRRVDAASVRVWQEQARLVCRIPNLRGHDAQLLVACDLTSPEELAAMTPAKLLAKVQVVAGSTQGQRILRGSQEPDLTEVTNWIHWASHCRALSAA